jgi:hypothetical protein
MFRSEDVEYYKIVIPVSNSWEVIDALGQIGCVHFRDENNFGTLSESNFFSNLRHCDEINHQID